MPANSRWDLIRRLRVNAQPTAHGSVPGRTQYLFIVAPSCRFMLLRRTIRLTGQHLCVTHVVRHWTGRFVYRQVPQQSPLFQFAVRWVSRILFRCNVQQLLLCFYSLYLEKAFEKKLVHCKAVNIRFVLNTFQEGAGNCLLWLAVTATHITRCSQHAQVSLMTLWTQ